MLQRTFVEETETFSLAERLKATEDLKFLLSLLWYIWLFYRDSTYILLTRDVIL